MKNQYVGNQKGKGLKIQLVSDDYIDSKSKDFDKDEPPSMASFIDESMQLEIVNP